jgi:plasmid stabilization system protein ParE
LGADFLLCVEEIFERIRREPEMYPPVHNQVRRALIRRFPYGVFYFTEEQNIIVVAVVHAHRAPHQWMSRS